MLGALLDWCDGSVHLIGHSYGGLLAARLALADQGRIRSLTLIEPAIPGRRDEEETAVTGDLPGQLAEFLERAGPPGGWQGMSGSQQSYLLEHAEVFFAEVDAVRDDAHTPADCGKLTMPTLVIAGGASTPELLDHSRNVAAAIPEARLELVPGAGHMSPMSHSAQVNALVADHLRSHS